MDDFGLLEAVDLLDGRAFGMLRTGLPWLSSTLPIDGSIPALARCSVLGRYDGCGRPDGPDDDREAPVPWHLG